MTEYLTQSVFLCCNFFHFLQFPIIFVTYLNDFFVFVSVFDFYKQLMQNQTILMRHNLFSRLSQSQGRLGAVPFASKGEALWICNIGHLKFHCFFVKVPWQNMHVSQIFKGKQATRFFLNVVYRFNMQFVHYTLTIFSFSVTLSLASGSFLLRKLFFVSQFLVLSDTKWW